MNIEKYNNIGSPVYISENNVIPYFIDLSRFMENKGVQLSPMPKITLCKDTQYNNNPFGKTAHYDPYNKIILLYISGRHIKDILRSFAHEMIHHSQNISGMLDYSKMTNLSNPKYAQENPHLEEMEADAYLRGNMLFRAWEDQYK